MIMSIVLKVRISLKFPLSPNFVESTRLRSENLVFSTYLVSSLSSLHFHIDANLTTALLDRLFFPLVEVLRLHL